MNKPQECNFDEIMNYFKGWGFSNKHLDYIGKLSYENTGYC